MVDRHMLLTGRKTSAEKAALDLRLEVVLSSTEDLDGSELTADTEDHAEHSMYGEEERSEC